MDSAYAQQDNKAPRLPARRALRGARIVWLALVPFCALPAVLCSQSIAFTNGRWFDGRTFEPRTMYAVNGVLRTSAPATIDRNIDLHDGYVIPPFGEAHNHNVEGSARTDALIERYLSEGIFYVLNPNSLPRSRELLAGKINQPNAIDVVFANGGLNAPGGHPYDLVRRNIARGIWTAAEGEGAFYHTIDDAAALAEKWPAIVAARPDFIKIYLLYSNEFEKRRNDTTYHGFKGLDPRLVPHIVKRAHDAGLRVAAHIENVHDFRAAVAGGVDIIAHMPGYGWPGAGDSTEYKLTVADASAAARAGTAVITTLAFGRRANVPNRALPHVRRDNLNAANLRALKQAGVTIAIGSDNYGNTSLSEALYLSDLDVFTNLELLELWSHATASVIFPKRKIGELREGFEASFLVLEQDPLADFSNVQRISLRVKQGTLLE